MKKTDLFVLLLTLGCVLYSAGCLIAKDSVTTAEAQEGVEQSVATTSANLLVDGTVEISTSFTLGQAVEAAAQELYGWAQSQIPCATATLAGTTVTIDFGTLTDSCTYNGQNYAGQLAITVKKSGDAEAQVSYQATNFTNGVVTANGTITVTWSASKKTRQVVHQVTFSYKGQTLIANADRTMSFVDANAGFSGGVKVDGSASWSVGSATWKLSIVGVEVRAVDAVPQSGTYTLTAPSGKSLSLSFSRLDTTTIRVTVTTGKLTFSFNVSQLGAVQEV